MPTNHESARSNAGMALDSGAISPGNYYKEVGLNTVTFGVKGQIDTGIQYYNGDITADEASSRIGSVGVFQATGAYSMYRQGGIYTRPVSKLPGELYQAVRTGNRPQAWDLSDAAATRFANDPHFGKLLNAATENPVVHGRPRVYEGSLGSRGQFQISASGRYGAPLPEGITYPPGMQSTSCAMPKALSACGDPFHNAVTSGGIMMNQGSIFGVSCKPRPQYWSPCTRCQQTLNLNPGVGRISPPPISTPLDVMPQFVPFGQPLSPEF